MPNNDNVWLISVDGCSYVNADELLLVMKSRLSKLNCELGVLKLPANTLKFTSFDDLIKIVDDLNKLEHNNEQLLKRIKKSCSTKFYDFDKIVDSTNETVYNSKEELLFRFKWDEIRFPPNSNIRKITERIQDDINNSEEHIKSVQHKFNELNTTLNNMIQKQNPKEISFYTQLEHLSEIVNLKNFKIIRSSCNSEHIENEMKFLFDTSSFTSLFMVISSKYYNNNNNKSLSESISEYSLNQYLIPETFFNTDLVDQNGSQLWVVSCLRNKITEVLDELKKNHKISAIPIDYEQLNSVTNINRINSLKNERNIQEKQVVQIVYQSYCDIYINLIHLKIIKLYADSVLRYGIPVSFFSYYLKFSNSKEKKVTNFMTTFFNKENRIESEHLDKQNHFTINDMIALEKVDLRI